MFIDTWYAHRTGTGLRIFLEFSGQTVVGWVGNSSRRSTRGRRSPSDAAPASSIGMLKWNEMHPWSVIQYQEKLWGDANMLTADEHDWWPNCLHGRQVHYTDENNLTASLVACLSPMDIKKWINRSIVKRIFCRTYRVRPSPLWWRVQAAWAMPQGRGQCSSCGSCVESSVFFFLWTAEMVMCHLLCI